jgi:chemotaxis protein MotA
MDVATVAGLLVALAALVGGLLLEKGELKDIAQYTAAIIVLGGTAGAVMVSTPMRTLRGAMRRLRTVFFVHEPDPEALIDELIQYATQARRQGLMSLDAVAAQVEDPFLRKALELAVDGTDLVLIRNMMELKITMEEQRAEAEAKVFEAAGGYAPTIGIIGAVMGLIQVMKNLANIDEVGHGIAVAFVATVYGVAAANLLLLPAANKIKARAQHETHMRELMLEGVLAIAEGLNPKLLRAKLEAFEHRTHSHEPKSTAARGD